MTIEHGTQAGTRVSASAQRSHLAGKASAPSDQVGGAFAGLLGLAAADDGLSGEATTVFGEDALAPGLPATNGTSALASDQGKKFDKNWHLSLINKAQDATNVDISAAPSKGGDAVLAMTIPDGKVTAAAADAGPAAADPALQSLNLAALLGQRGLTQPSPAQATAAGPSAAVNVSAAKPGHLHTSSGATIGSDTSAAGGQLVPAGKLLGVAGQSGALPATGQAAPDASALTGDATRPAPVGASGAGHGAADVASAQQAGLSSQLARAAQLSPAAQAAAAAQVTASTAPPDPAVAWLGGGSAPGTPAPSKSGERSSRPGAAGADQGVEGGFGQTLAGVVSSDALYEVAPAAATVADTGVAETVAYWVTQGVQNAKLTVDGLGQGPVEVSISLANDQAQVQFMTDQPQTQQVLQNSASRLRDLLAAHGLQLTALSVGSQGTQREGSQRFAREPAAGVQTTRVGAATAAGSGPVGVRRPVDAAVGRSLDLFV
jgi:flagellar hook-length control protein FliK